MDSSLDHPRSVSACYNKSLLRRSQSSTLLRSVRDFGHRLSKSADPSTSTRQKIYGVCAKATHRPKTWDCYVAPRKDEDKADLQDYMTLTQLEDMWYTQDSVGSRLTIGVPTQSLGNHDTGLYMAPTLGIQYPPISLSESASYGGNSPDDHVVDGVVHPALRQKNSQWANYDKQR